MTRPRTFTSATDLLANLASTGNDIPGGCEHCNAYQRVVQHTDLVFVLTVFHDDWCPQHPGAA